MTKLDDLAVLLVDCQASGATPAHGDLLELGWAVTTGRASLRDPRAEWLRTEKPVSRIVRKLTGWDEAAAAAAIDPAEAWSRLQADVAAHASTGLGPAPRAAHADLAANAGPDRTTGTGLTAGAHATDAAAFAMRGLASLDAAATRLAARAAPPAARFPTVIHFARFELAFLRVLQEPLPLDVVCLHRIAERLFPHLPRRNLRALAGHLGGAPEVLRRAGPHVAATAFVWRAVVPLLAELGVATWDDLATWLAAPMSRPRRIARDFPLPPEKRRALPDSPGVYRFLRPNGDVLYVGKAASLKKRVASHFTTAKSKTHERALEMLSQAHDVEVTTTATALEAALFEVDEIKRLDPPYNVQLRMADRSAWFASRDWASTASAVDDTHVIGPLPSRNALSGIAAMRQLLEGAPLTLERACAAVGVPHAFAPPLDLFAEEWSKFHGAELGLPAPRRILEAAARITVQDSPAEEDAPADWDAATIRRYLERIVVGEGTLVRRARLLALLAYAQVTFREPNHEEPRVLVFHDGAKLPSRRARIATFDAARYDRLRVLATELRRVATSGGQAELRIGHHVLRVT